MKLRIGVIVLFVVLALATGGFFVLTSLNRPLAQPLSIKTVPTATSALPQPSVAPVKKAENCGLSGSMMILNLGLSTERPKHPVAAESIRMVRIDIDQKKVMVFSLPRDLVVKTPALEDAYGLAQSQLGDIYSVVLTAEKKSAKPEDAGYKATQAMAQVIYDHFGITADHYIAMDNDVMWDAIDTLEGIPVKVQKDFKARDGEPYYGLVISKGDQTLGGLEAHAYYTQRDSSPQEWDRTERQDAVFDGLYDKVLSIGALPKMPELYQQFKEKIVTDASPAQIVSTACVVKDIPTNKYRLDEVALNEVIIQKDGSFLLKDFDATLKKMQKFLLDR